MVRIARTLFNAHGYNVRSELVSSARTGGAPSLATEHEYGYDDIGNRTSSSDLGTTRAYTANSLNQYTEISTLRASAPPRETFIPQFDDDGNQTLIRTRTGTWSVAYNGENRPILWECGSTNITMSFNRMGRRVSYTETEGVTTNAHCTFTYDNYLCIQQIEDSATIHYSQSPIQCLVWDPTEPVATRPLVWHHNGGVYFYTHDGNKNVSELVDDSGAVTAHYEYAPFGDVTVASGNLAFDNPFRFSSEYADDVLGLVYYNYRHYEPVTGRWMGRDPINSMHYLIWRTVVDKSMVYLENLYSYIGNSPNAYYDKLGLMSGGMSARFWATICCKDSEGRRREIPYYIWKREPCCNNDETKVPISQCTCISCGEGQYDEALGAGVCIGDSNNGGYGDAFRHCYGSCKISKVCGNFCAFVLGWGNEIISLREWFSDSPMDISNNSKGRGVASKGKDCATGCLDLLYGGGLRVDNKIGQPYPRETAESEIKKYNY